MRPHKTHQAGISVDFMVPVLDATGVSVAMPSGAFNKFGYAIEFDVRGRYQDLRIDYEAMAEHLHQLAQAARRHGVCIARVSFDPALTTQLLATRRGRALHLPFMKQRPWIRHDEHYHVDFDIACKPLRDRPAR